MSINICLLYVDCIGWCIKLTASCEKYIDDAGDIIWETSCWCQGDCCLCMWDGQLDDGVDGRITYVNGRRACTWILQIMRISDIWNVLEKEMRGEYEWA